MRQAKGGIFSQHALRGAVRVSGAPETVKVLFCFSVTKHTVSILS